MKLIDKDEKHPPFDCASGMAEGLLATGNFKVYTPPEKPKRTQDLVWKVFEGQTIEGIVDPPFITYHCNTCSNNGHISGPTAHKTQVARCCGTFSKVPDHIADQYVALRKKWEPKHKRYIEAIRRRAEDREKMRQALLLEDRRRLATQLIVENRTSQD